MDSTPGSMACGNHSRGFNMGRGIVLLAQAGIQKKPSFRRRPESSGFIIHSRTAGMTTTGMINQHAIRQNLPVIHHRTPAFLGRSFQTRLYHLRPVGVDSGLRWNDNEKKIRLSAIPISPPSFMDTPASMQASFRRNDDGSRKWKARNHVGRMCGNRITSRIVAESVRNMTSRSMPMPSPAVGGRPYSRAVI